MAQSLERTWVGASVIGNYRRRHTLKTSGTGCKVSTSVGMALWISLNLPGRPENPTLEPVYVLVYGGITASGTFAIHLLKLQVITFYPFLVLKAQQILLVV